MSDLEKVKQYHQWLGDEFVLEKEGNNPEFDQVLTVGEKGDWYWITYMFKDDKLVKHWLSE